MPARNRVDRQRPCRAARATLAPRPAHRRVRNGSPSCRFSIRRARPPSSDASPLSRVKRASQRSRCARSSGRSWACRGARRKRATSGHAPRSRGGSESERRDRARRRRRTRPDRRVDRQGSRRARCGSRSVRLRRRGARRRARQPRRGVQTRRVADIVARGRCRDRDSGRCVRRCVACPRALGESRDADHGRQAARRDASSPRRTRSGFRIASSALTRWPATIDPVGPRRVRDCSLGARAISAPPIARRPSPSHEPTRSGARSRRTL